MTDRIPFTVVGGYLGAGKTTLVNHILTGDHGRRIAVIVNDFGDVAVDEALVDASSDTVRSLANGCVCCTLTDGFASTLREIRALEPAPEHVLVEVSGVGDPWAVAQWGRTPGFELDGVVVLVDPETIAERVDDRYVGDTVRAQLDAADVIVLSRADVLAPVEMAEAAALVERHSAAPVLRDGPVPLELLLGRPSAGVAAPASHAHHRSWTVPAPALARAPLTVWLERAPEGVIRVKGFVPSPDADDGVLLVQRVGRRVEVVRHRGAPNVPRVIVVVATAAADPAAVESWLERLV